MFDVEDLTALNISLSDYLKTAAVNSNAITWEWFSTQNAAKTVCLPGSVRTSWGAHNPSRPLAGLGGVCPERGRGRERGKGTGEGQRREGNGKANDGNGRGKQGSIRKDKLAVFVPIWSPGLLDPPCNYQFWCVKLEWLHCIVKGCSAVKILLLLFRLCG